MELPAEWRELLENLVRGQGRRIRAFQIATGLETSDLTLVCLAEAVAGGADAGSPWQVLPVELLRSGDHARLWAAAKPLAIEYGVAIQDFA
jgi:hypothetical protein